MRPATLAWSAGLALLVALAVVGYGHHAQRRAEPAQADARLRFAHWQAAEPTGQAAAYLAYLEQRGVGQVLPQEQLLRLGRRWRACGGQEFAVPPPALWPRIVPTLKLLRQLQAQGLMRNARVASAWRPAAFNRCEGGSPASRHLDNLALDLDLATPGQIEVLCAAWRRLGPERRWGLGFYSPTRVHLDTSGFRTWGYDYHSGSSLCRAANGGRTGRIG